MKIFKIIFLLVLVLGGLQSFAQNKIEREVGIKEKRVPSVARAWMKDVFEEIKKPKWYEEFSEVGRSFEAKFRWQDRFYSVEFDSLGNLQDVEIEIKWSDLSNEIDKNITDYFENSLKSFKLEKIQIQYSGPLENIEDFFEDGELEGVLVQYEIEFQAGDESGIIRLWEGIFTSEGKFVKSRKIEVREAFNQIF
jgi:hypothetical protein